MLTRMVSIFCPRDPTASSQALQAHFEPSDDLDRPSSFLPVASAGLAFASQLWHEAERGLPGGDALGVLGPDLHLHQEERIEAGLHRCHHPPERGLSGARGVVFLKLISSWDLYHGSKRHCSSSPL
uniref:uncharacterized protein LOC118147848 isoform X6 n=1 Tax=Callithrix jacchus TaxID=9483 RepID=UPI0023DD2B33|nr:uncharacterized protein LOC118147848 isoform X6 [Callithrix jacchus]